MQDRFHQHVQAADALISNALGNYDAFTSIEKHFNAIVDERLYIPRLNAIIAANLAGKMEVTPDLSSGQFFLLHGSPVASWAILIHSRRSRHLYLTPSHSMSAHITDAPVTVDRYQVPSGFDLQTYDEAVQLRLKDSGQPSERSVFVKHGTQEILDVTPAATEPAYTLRVNTVPFGDFEWSFSRETLRPVQMNAVKRLDSNLTTIFDLLAAVGSPDSLDQLDTYTKHPAHFVRWRAVQTIGAIDEARGAELVLEAVNDPHPHVREAARTTLAQAG